jgi:hypothetical protein
VHVITDKESRSSKLQRKLHVNNALHTIGENGRVRETPISAAVACLVERDGRDASTPCDNVVGPSSHPPLMYSKKEQQSNGKIDVNLPPVVLAKPPGGSPRHVEAVAFTRPSNHSLYNESSQRPEFASQRLQGPPDLSICDNLPPLASWSTLYDQDWLYTSSERPYSKPKVRVEEYSSQEVWAEAVYLSAVEMYALPYVAPY